MVMYLVLFIQQNVARRHEPTAAISRLITELLPFTFLRRDSSYLENVIRTTPFPFVFEQLRDHIGCEGFLPRILPLALVQEPVIQGGIPVGFSNLKVLHAGTRSRAIIVTANCANISLLDHKSNGDLSLALLYTGKTKVIVGSFYHDISKDEVDLNTEGWNDLAGDLILGGDTNGHSGLWGSPLNNSRGDSWEEFVMINDLYVANNDNAPTFSNHIGESHIDATLSRRDRICGWQNTGFQHGSDHCLITFKLTSGNATVDKSYQNLALTDWNIFKSSLPKLTLNRIANTHQLEERASHLIEIIKDAFNRACPPKRAFPGKPCKWWSRQLSNLLRNKNIAAKEARKYCGTFRGIRARKKKVALGKLLNKHIRLAKKESWEKFISDTTSPKTISSLYKHSKNGKTMDMPLLKKDSSWAKNHLDNLKILRESHFSKSSINFSRNYGDDETQNELPRDLDEFLTWDILQKAIQELPNGKAPGPDGIRNELIKKLPEDYMRELLIQFRFSIRTGFIPTSWLEINTVYIRKQGKPESDSPKTYRPIGLSSCLLKLCERLVNWRLKSTVLSKGIPKQHAFTVNRSTESALSEVVNVLEKAKLRGQKAMLLSIDIQGAFDSVPFDEIKSALIEHGADSHTTAWLDYLSRNRVITTTQGNETLSFRPEVGTTQGGLNSPDLWAIFLWNLIFLRAVKESNSVIFADDLSAIIIGVCMHIIRDLIQGCLTQFNTWFEQRGLKLSASKSVCMVFDNNPRAALPAPLMLSGTTIPYVNEMKYLGIIIDNKLSWKPHINYRIKKAKKDLVCAKKMISDNWGLTPDKALWLYESIVRPALDYACHVWAHVDSWPVWLVKELTKVQRLALLIATRAQRSTPTRALERLVNVLPLHLHIKQKAASTIARIYNAVDRANWDGLGNNGKKGHLLKWKSYLDNLSCPLTLCHLYNFEKVDVDLKGSISPNELKEVLMVYTDGSKMDSNAGLGWCVTFKNYLVSEGCCKLPEHSTVYEAELLAIECAVKDLEEIMSLNKYSGKNVHFFVDNKAALFTLNSTRVVGECRVRVVRVIKEFIQKRKEKVTFHWIKGHSNMTGNEMADLKAKEGCSSQTNLLCSASMSYIKGKVREKVNNEWHTLWNNLNDCRQSRELISFKPCKRERIYLTTRGTITCKKLVALMTGHNNMRYHTFKRTVDTNPYFSPCCRYCEDDVESSWHLLYDCPSLDNRRRDFMYSPDNPKTGPDIQWYHGLATTLGIMDIVLTRSDTPGMDNVED